jgi:transcriptional regulator with XRE-family HTH domain
MSGMSIANETRANTFLGAPSTLLVDHLLRAAEHLAWRRKILGDQIRAAREAKHWKQKELARRVHVEPQTVSNWERGVRMPDWDKLDLIAGELGKPLSYFVTDGAREAAEQADVQRELAEMRGALQRMEELLRDLLDQPQAAPAAAVARARGRAGR